MLLQPITLLFSNSTLKLLVYTLTQINDYITVPMSRNIITDILFGFIASMVKKI